MTSRYVRQQLGTMCGANRPCYLPCYWNKMYLICFRKYPRVTNGRVVQLGRPIADQFSSCAMNKPLLLPMTALANWQATDLYKCGSSLLSLEFVYKILIFAVLQRWLLEQRETGASFVYITTSTNVSIFHRSAVPTWYTFKLKSRQLRVNTIRPTKITWTNVI